MSEPYDVQAVKKELLKQGREQGYLDVAVLRDALPAGLITPTEVQTFLFTLDMMEIELRLEDGTIREPGTRLAM